MNGPKLRKDFPAHQMGLPGPVYDALPDGWGMLLMDRLFKRRGLNAARIGPLEQVPLIEQICDVASTFTAVARSMFPSQTKQETLRVIQGRINENIKRLR